MQVNNQKLKELTEKLKELTEKFNLDNNMKLKGIISELCDHILEQISPILPDFNLYDIDIDNCHDEDSHFILYFKNGKGSELYFNLSEDFDTKELCFECVYDVCKNIICDKFIFAEGKTDELFLLESKSIISSFVDKISKL